MLPMLKMYQPGSSVPTCVQLFLHVLTGIGLDPIVKLIGANMKLINTGILKKEHHLKMLEVLAKHWVEIWHR